MFGARDAREARRVQVGSYALYHPCRRAPGDGVKKKLGPGDPLEGGAYPLDNATRRRPGVGELPRTLLETPDKLQSDHGVLRPVFDGNLLEAYIEVKRRG